MHPLLQRQISKHLTEAPSIANELKKLLSSIDQAYRQSDEDRQLLERSIEISSNELRQRNQDLQTRLNELQQTRDQLERSYSLLRSTLDSTADAIVVVGLDQRIRAHNRQFADFWQARAAESMVGENFAPHVRRFLRMLKNRSEVTVRLHELRGAGMRKSQVMLELQDGRFLEMTSIPQVQGQAVVGRVFSFHDVTEKRTDEEIIRHQAYHDALTGLPNRLLMHDRLRHAIHLAKRTGQKVCVFFLDLDHFKSVNDRLGHDIGDKLLIEVTQRLRGRLREADTICRFGGDEFTIILENMADDSSWKPVAQQLIERLAQPFEIAGHEIWVTTSIGVSQYPGDAETAEDLVRHADMAMYDAKHLGRNRFSQFNLILQYETDRKASIEAELRYAIAANEFSLVFQPKYALANMQVVGFECLLRWHNRKLGQIAPDEFIAIAEQCGMIIPIGHWVLQQACRQLAAWHRAGHGHVSMAINLSVQQFQHPDLIKDIRQALRDHHLAPQSIELEITESCVMVDVEQVTRLLLTLQNLGVALAIDDFGSGYSSMSYLKNLPVTSLKIDRAFIRDISTAADDAAIVASIITLGHNLGLTVVAEGVEDEAGLLLLKELHCDLVQGFLMSRPLSEADATTLLEHTANPSRP